VAHHVAEGGADGLPGADPTNASDEARQCHFGEPPA
jgi:hypothetical protein